jgi:uncharacterized membrane protein YdjX (TVP38/TMEM64 family)
VSQNKRNIAILFIFCLVTTVAGVYLLGGVKPAQIKAFLESLGIWAPVIYILLYIVGTLFLLPSTPLNLTGGALFGVFWGTFWTALGAILAAIISFAFIPYGLVNFAAGLTSIKFKDYLIGTILGTIPGIFPFVMMGSGLNQLHNGNIIPLLSGSGLVGVLVGVATWYRRRRTLRIK